MAVPSLLLLLAPLSAPPAQDLPFESLGKALLAQADSRAGEAKVKPNRAGPIPPRRALLTRLAALHQRLRLGAVEIWIPLVAIEPEGALATAPEAKAFQSPARMLLSLERAWLRRGAADEVDLAQAAPAIGRLEGWVRTLKADLAPEQGAEVVAARRLLSILLLQRRGAAPPEDREDYDLVVIVAPTRAHYIGVLGAAGIVAPERVADLWSPTARRSAGVVLESDVALVASAWGGPEGSRKPLESWTMSSAEAAQGIVHAADHLLAIRIVPAAPAWFTEGLAICDTVDVSRADETLCSGNREYASVPGSVAGAGPSTLLVWVTHDKSPFRGGPSSRHFVKVLRGFLARGGVTVLDLDTGRPAFTVEDPLLGYRASVPPQVEHGSDGLKKGFAELYRAWCAGFVHYLAELETAGGPALPQVLARIREASMGAAELAQGALDEALLAVTGKQLETLDPAKDIEVAFAAWLASQR